MEKERKVWMQMKIGGDVGDAGANCLGVHIY